MLCGLIEATTFPLQNYALRLQQSVQKSQHGKVSTKIR